MNWGVVGNALFFTGVAAGIGVMIAEVISAIMSKPRRGPISMERQEYADARAEALHEPLPVIPVESVPRVPPYVGLDDLDHTEPIRMWQNESTYRSRGRDQEPDRVEQER